MEILKKLMLFVLFAAITGFISCSSDDDNNAPIDDPNDNPQSAAIGSFTLSDIPLVGEEVFVENFTMPMDGWIVVRRDSGNNTPVMSEIISIPENVLAGNYTEYSINLEENLDLQQGERLWVNLHHDDGDQIFSYDGSSDADFPLGTFDPFAGYTMISQSFVVDLP
ncbi:DUF7282 domain-containing protein [Salinimicrobium xinjiangense]|uniref:DUF7282 domain-containing protein n=1 Tax=Salinimicrobium xinjiangense TaxID=438596 RepID=UPI0003F77557|nr:hypothetical protein [Salinimicrobium xinjiangense]